MRKQISIGFIFGLVLTFTLLCTLKGTFAATKTAQTVNYPIYIDNKVWVPTTPALNVEGSTYLPLRAMSEALGVQIDWSKEYRRVDVYKNKKPGDFQIGDGSKTPDTPSVPESDSIYGFINQNCANNLTELGANIGVIDPSDDELEIIYNLAGGGSVRFDLTNMIYKSIDTNGVATWVEFNKDESVKAVSIAARAILDTNDEKYVAAVNEYKKNLSILQNSILKNTKKTNLYGIKVSEAKNIKY